ncbi:unnamed protein product [Auanema sp. JU1783]|nr:unnamed protein product [Auanema sp. JU1783]
MSYNDDIDVLIANVSIVPNPSLTHAPIDSLPLTTLDDNLLPLPTLDDNSLPLTTLDKKEKKQKKKWSPQKKKKSKKVQPQPKKRTCDTRNIPSLLAQDIPPPAAWGSSVTLPAIWQEPFYFSQPMPHYHRPTYISFVQAQGGCPHCYPYF